MTEETIDDVKQAYALLFKAHGELRAERDALLDKVRDFGGRMTDEQSSTLADLDDAIAASTPKVLTEADIAGLPRAVSSEQALALTVDLQFISGFVFDPRPKSAIHRASDIIEKLVSERDALAGRVAELEADAKRYVFLADALTSGDIYNALQKGFENFDQDRPPTREEFDAGIDMAIDAALSATTPESKP